MSLHILFGRDADVAHWVALKIPHAKARVPDFPYGGVFGPSVALGVVNDQDQMLAGVVFHNHDPYVRSIEVSCASSGARWGNREVFRSLLRYPFTQIGCRRITAATPRKATSTRRFLEGLGFKREGSIEYGFGDDNAIIYGLLAERWNEGRFCRNRGEGLIDGQEERTRGAPGP